MRSVDIASRVTGKHWHRRGRRQRRQRRITGSQRIIDINKSCAEKRRSECEFVRGGEVESMADTFRTLVPRPDVIWPLLFILLANSVLSIL